MWAASMFQAFLHMLYDKEVLDESVILQWYSHKGGDVIGLETQRKQLRQQVCKPVTLCIHFMGTVFFFLGIYSAFEI